MHYPKDKHTYMKHAIFLVQTNMSNLARKDGTDHIYRNDFPTCTNINTTDTSMYFNIQQSNSDGHLYFSSVKYIWVQIPHFVYHLHGKPQ